MFAINHAAVALAIKKKYPTVRMVWLLLSVQAVEILWVVLNFAGVESVRTEAEVGSVRDIHLHYMPYSHSVASTLLVASIAWACFRLARLPKTAAAAGVAVLSHLFLDLLTHNPDIPLVSYHDPDLLFGSGLYGAFPFAAFAFEAAFGIGCWWYYGGSKRLLAGIVVFNMMNITLFLPGVEGVEALLAGRPEAIVALVAFQIAATLGVVGWLAGRARPELGTVRERLSKGVTR